jgi:hypothetical protein
MEVRSRRVDRGDWLKSGAGLLAFAAALRPRAALALNSDEYEVSEAVILMLMEACLLPALIIYPRQVLMVLPRSTGHLQQQQQGRARH